MLCQGKHELTEQHACTAREAEEGASREDKWGRWKCGSEQGWETLGRLATGMTRMLFGVGALVYHVSLVPAFSMKTRLLQSFSNPPASASQILGLQEQTFIPINGSLLINFFLLGPNLESLDLWTKRSRFFLCLGLWLLWRLGSLARSLLSSAIVIWFLSGWKPHVHT